MNVLNLEMVSSSRDWMEGPCEPTAEASLHGLVAAWAACAPEAVAVVGERQALTYGELEVRAERLAHLLSARGVGPEVPVGLCLGGAPARVVGLLAILKAGGAFVPLDPGDPAERLAFLLADCGAPLVVAESRFASRLPPTLPAVYLDRGLDREGAALAARSPAPPPAETGPSSLAYVIYTSGSTGRPKGVLVTHGGAVNMVRETVRILRHDTATRMFQGASPGFDASVFEIFPLLAAGGCLVLGRDETSLVGPELARRLGEERVTTLFLPPPVLETLEPGELPDVRTLVVAGDSCPAATAERWAAGRHFHNLYGPTEATIFATGWSAPSGPVDFDRSPPIGRPIANARVQLVDPAVGLAPVPPGEVGELTLGGVGIARGYLGRPDLTAERFVPDPAAGTPGERLYRTGDLARLLPEGDLEFVGRADRQVKIRGVRVEPGEVEAALLRQPGIAEAVVVAREDRPGGRRLVAYLVARPGEPLSPRELQAALARELAAVLVPSAFVLLDHLPLSASGKVDRRALPEPPDAPEGEREAAPEGAAEETLAALFREVLGLPWIGAEDDFFALGGHSLLAARLAARVRRDLAVELPMALLVAHPTVRELARALAARAGTPEGAPLPPLVPGPRPARLPLSFPQERVWFLDRLAPGNVAYNVQAEFRLRGPLVPAALARALSEVVRRHEVLRTRFPAAEDGEIGRPVQIVEAPWEVPLPLWDLTGLSVAIRERAAAGLVAAEVRRPFALDRLPLVRWRLLRLAADEHVLLQVEHHLLHDGWSFSLLSAEMTALYAAFVAGRPSPLPAPSLQYADFALWQRAYLSGQALADQLAWWRERLTGSPPVLTLPADRPRPSAHSFRGDALVATVPRPLYQELRRHARRSGTTLFMTMFAGFAALFSRLSGQEDLAVGSGVANRRLAESERMLGMVVNTVVLRTDLSGDPTFAGLLARVREGVLGAQAHQDLPFEKLVEALRPERRLAVNPLFQMLFSFHDSAMPELSFGGLTGRFAPRPNGSAKADLNVVVLPRAEQRAGAGDLTGDEDLEIVWEYSSDLFDRTTAARMLASYLTLLAAVIADPELPLSALPLLDAAARHQLAVEWNDRAVPFPREAAVHGVFAAVVAAGADRTATVFGAEHLSYGELEARSNRLGHALLARKVGLEVPVALFLPRSPELVVATLAVLKAGGCYVPLDPSHPAERQRRLLEEMGEPLVLTLDRLAAGLPDGTRTLCLDGGAGGKIAHGLTPLLPTGGGGDRLCYVIYTSGSTGRPKGVAVSHRAVLRLVFGGFVKLGPGDRVGHVSNTAFDAATFEIWGALLTGATLSGLSREEALTPRGLAEAFAAGRVDVLFLTATLFHQVAREDPQAFGPLSALLFGGEAADPAWVRAVAGSSAPPGKLLNGYGPTESTTFAVVHQVDPLSPLPPDAATVPIGRPIGNTQAHVLDRRLRPQPIGVPGELCLGGEGLARGYLGRPERTAERFVPHPLADQPGDRLYRTGDRVRVLPDGVLDLLGRLDGQVKIRGFRVELGEVEAALRRHPAVAEAAAALRGEGAERRLVGYVVLAAPALGEERGEERQREILAGLRAFLKPLLPEPMIPAAFASLPALPVNANGKLDRAALPSPEGARQAAPESFVAPRTPVEARVAALWAELLRLDRVGVRDDFFALGGHSLLVTQVLSRLCREYEIEIPMRVLFEAPTVEGLAAEIERCRQEPRRPVDRPLRETAEEIDAADLLARLDDLSADEMDALMERLVLEGEEER